MIFLLINHAYHILKLVRILNIPPFGPILQEAFYSFADEKDTFISLSPMYLLCGLSATLWLPTESMRLLPLMSGILTIGVGDSAASMIGSKWGNHKWVESHKSIEGTIACVVSQLIFIFGFATLGMF